MIIFKELWLDRHKPLFGNEHLHETKASNNDYPLDAYYLFPNKELSNYPSSYHYGGLKRASDIHKITQYGKRIYFIDFKQIVRTPIMMRHFERFTINGSEVCTNLCYKELRQVSTLIKYATELFKKKNITFHSLQSFLTKLEERYPLSEDKKNKGLKRYNKLLKKYDNKGNNEGGENYMTLGCVGLNFEESNNQQKEVLKY